MTGLRRLVVEIHRRSLWQVLSIYLIGAWVAYQVILGLTDGIGLPDWVPGLAVVLFLIGLPVVVATAFVNEGPPMRESLSRQGGRWGTAGPGGGERRSGGAPVGAAAGPHWLTWRRSMVTGLLAFAVLGTGTAGFMVMRVAGLGAPGTLVAKGALDARDVVVLADFRSASDASLGTVVAEALRIDLLQTTILRVADPAYVRETLRLMQRDPADGLPVDVALELAKREGLKAVLTGDVATLGGGYILSVELLAGSDGRVLAAFREVARDSTQLIDAVDALSKQIRAKAGESLRTVRSSEPLSRLSTSSLPALRKYGEAMRTDGDQLRMVALLEEAIALDSMFAAAHRKLGIALGNLGIRRTDRIAALTRAYELRDRLPERERLHAIGSYHGTVTLDRQRAAEAYRAVLALDPDDDVATNNLPVLLFRLGRVDEAVSLLERIVEEGTPTSSHFTNLAAYRYAVGRTDDAAATIAEAVSLMPRDVGLVRMEPRLAAARGDFEAADSMAASRAERFPPRSTGRLQLTRDRASFLLARGRLDDFQRLATELQHAAAGLELRTQVLLASLWPIVARVEITGHRRYAMRDIDAVLHAYPLDSIPRLERPYTFLAMAAALAGEFDRADAFIHEWQLNSGDMIDPDVFGRTRAAVSLMREPSAGAIDELRRYRSPECQICILPDIGRAFEALAQPDSAIAAYRRFVETPMLARFDVDATNLAFILVRLGELLEAAGRPDDALPYYLRFLDLWKDADPELQPRVAAIRTRIQALRGEG